MKITIESYAGTNKVITTAHDVVKLPVNAPHPKAGATLEIEDDWVIGKATKDQIEASKGFKESDSAAKAALEDQKKADDKARADADKKK